MILRKPYAFLIKNFRLIHLALLLLSAYICYKLTPIVSFFRSYVANNYSATISANFSAQFINFFLYLSVILLLIIIIAIIYLFIYKKKEFKTYRFYIVYVIYYLIIFVLLFVWSNIFTSLETSVIAADLARIYQDLFLIAYVPQFLFIIICFVRALGFDIKQFDFRKDAKDLEIDIGDNEEVEVNLGFDTYKTERTIRRFLREFIYYVKENKLIVLIVGSVLAFFFVKSIVTGVTSYTSKYKTGETFTYKNLQITVNDSILTNLDQGGKIIENGKYYLLLKVTIANNTTKGIDFDYDNLKIYYGKNHFNPSLDLGINFVDYGYPYSDKTIAKKSSNTYVFVYKIDESLIKQKFYVKLHTGIVENKNVYYATSDNISINPLLISDVTNLGTYNLNDEINLNSTYLKESKISISDYKIANRYLFNYDYCLNGSCSTKKDLVVNNTTGKTLLILTGNISIDNNCDFAKTSKYGSTFINDFVTIEYTLDGTTYTTTVQDMTPSDLTNRYVIQTSDKITNATNINLIITIRNKQYRITLK